MKLSEVQKRTLLRAIEKGERITYGTRGDTSMRALARHGLAAWNSQIGSTYGKPYWWITDAGIAEAKKLAALSRSENW